MATKNESKGMLRFENEGQACLCGNLRKASRIVTQVYDEALRPIGIRPSQLYILVCTSSMQPATVNRLAEATVTDRTTLTRNLKPLQKQGLVRIELGKDRREREVTLTGKGRGMIKKAYPIWEKVQGRMAKAIGKNKVNQLLADLSEAMEEVRAA